MKKDDKKIHDEQDLAQKLEEAHDMQSKKHDDAQLLVLQKRIEQLEQEKKEVEEIAKRSQYDYVNLKMDFDRYQRQTKENQSSAQVDALLAVVKKFLPFVEDLRKSLTTITDDHKQDPLTKGVQMIFDKFLSTLHHMHITSIEAVGLVPDSFLHEPISVQEVEDKAMKGKIIQEFERGFVYKHGDDVRVITPAKVIVGK
ncbi:MAG: nucleotide exchange factor GrpE [bacterium]